MRLLNLTEYKTEESVKLSQVERDSLMQAVRSLTIVPTPGKPGRYDCTPGSWVGTVTTDAIQVIIRPKLDINRVMFLIAFVADPSHWQKIISPIDEATDFLNALVPSFVRHIRTAVGRGLLRGYLTIDDLLTTVRGRIRFGDQLALHQGRVPPIEVTFDEYTEDICENRLLATAIDRLLLLHLPNKAIAEDLRRVRHHFDGVTRIRDTRLLPEIRWTRLNEHYKHAVALAELVLRNTSLQLQKGDAPGTSFLVDMNRIFEDFVYCALKDRLKLDAKKFPQGCKGQKLRLDAKNQIQLKPDLSWWEGGCCLFVGDVKYKLTGDGKGKHPDLYQLLAYLVASKTEEGILVYAAGEANPATHAVTMVDKRLRIVTLDLSRPPPEILEQIAVIADGQELSKAAAVARSATVARGVAAASGAAVGGSESVGGGATVAGRESIGGDVAVAGGLEELSGISALVARERLKRTRHQ